MLLLLTLLPLYLVNGLTVGTHSLESAIKCTRAWRQAAAASKPAVGTVVTVDEAIVGERITNYLKRWTSTTSRATECCRRGEVLVNGLKVYGNYLLKDGDKVSLNLQSSIDALDDIDEKLAHRMSTFANILQRADQNPPLSVLYEDDHLAVVFKPSGVHSLAWTGTIKKNALSLDDILLLLLSPPALNRDVKHVLQRPLPCHRLDARVAGCLLIGKTVEALAILNKQFESRDIEKSYIAVLAGNASEALIRLSFTDSIDAVVNGKPATSGIRVDSVVPCNVYGSMSRVSLFPHSGRRHQLRQHCAYIGCPIIGDDAYHNAASYEDLDKRAAMIALAEKGETIEISKERAVPFAAVRERGGLYLMSTSIELTHPVTGQRLCIRAEATNKFNNIMMRARKGAAWNEEHKVFRLM